MVFLRFLQATAVMALGAVAASLSGSGNITPQDYYGLSPTALESTYPACGMRYSELNLALITAVEAMDTGSTCNQCLKVTNGDKSRSIYVLAVDLGGSGLDLSIPAFEYLFDQRYDASPASWSTVDSSYCDGIYTPGKTNPNQGIGAGSSSSGAVDDTSSKSTTRKTTTTTRKVLPTTTATTTTVAAETTLSTTETEKETEIAIEIPSATTTTTTTIIPLPTSIVKNSTTTVSSKPTHSPSSPGDDEKEKDDEEKKKKKKHHHCRHKKHQSGKRRGRHHVKRSMSWISLW